MSVSQLTIKTLDPFYCYAYENDNDSSLHKILQWQTPVSSFIYKKINIQLAFLPGNSTGSCLKHNSASVLYKRQEE